MKKKNKDSQDKLNLKNKKEKAMEEFKAKKALENKKEYEEKSATMKKQEYLSNKTKFKDET